MALETVLQRSLQVACKPPEARRSRMSRPVSTDGPIPMGLPCLIVGSLAILCLMVIGCRGIVTTTASVRTQAGEFALSNVSINTNTTIRSNTVVKVRVDK